MLGNNVEMTCLMDAWLVVPASFSKKEIQCAPGGGQVRFIADRKRLGLYIADFKGISSRFPECAEVGDGKSIVRRSDISRQSDLSMIIQYLKFRITRVFNNSFFTGINLVSAVAVLDASFAH